MTTSISAGTPTTDNVIRIKPPKSDSDNTVHRNRLFETVDGMARAGGSALGEVGYLTGILTSDSSGSIKGISTTGAVTTVGALGGFVGLAAVSSMAAKLGSKPGLSAPARGAIEGASLVLRAVAPTTAAIMAAPMIGEAASGIFPKVFKKTRDLNLIQDRDERVRQDDANFASKALRTGLAVAGIGAVSAALLLRKRPSEAEAGMSILKRIFATGSGARNVIAPTVLGGVSAFTIQNIYDQQGDYVRTRTLSRE